jgi:glucose-6-phosphate 1-epimerase
MQAPDALNQRFGASGRVAFDAGQGGLARALLTSAEGARAEVYLHGAHVTQYVKAAGGPPVLFVSKESLFRPDKAIRGGVPLIFPWFGPRSPDPAGNSPMHGFARTSAWEVESAGATGAGTSIVLVLRSNDATRKTWPHEFELRYTVTLGAPLTMELSVRNTGSGPFTFEEALHTYLTVADVRNVTIEGLAGTRFVDKTDNMATKTQDPSPPMKITAETDRIYLATKSTCTVADPGLGRRITVAKEHSDATVVWNPWVAKAKAMADFGDDEWLEMLCIETCNVAGHAVTLAAGATHAMRAVVDAGAL